jgi:eukaryotic-like serine/threonine-protein kinase
VGAPPESDREAISGFDCLHRVAQSYLGPLWIASDTRQGVGVLRLLRRLQLPEAMPAAALSEIVALGQKAMVLMHPNVLRVVDVVDRAPQLAMVYEHAEAEPLRSLQSWANLRGLSFPVGVALRIIADLLEGIAAVHELGASSPGLTLAGGLSPDSVLVSRDGRTQLCDPLIANGAALLQSVGFNTAKLAYAAPEQVHASAAPTPQADLFTCAAMLWELLASRRLLAGSRPAIERKLLEHNLPSLGSSLRGPHQLSAELVALVERALSADPAARPASARAFARELGQSGYELAPISEVAAFVGKLSGPRFDRRSSALRSRAAVPLDGLELPNELPTGSSGRRGAPPSSDAARAVDTPRADEPVSSTERTQLSAGSFEGLESASAEPSRLENLVTVAEAASVTQRSVTPVGIEPPRPSPRVPGSDPSASSAARTPISAFSPAPNRAPRPEPVLAEVAPAARPPHANPTTRWQSAGAIPHAPVTNPTLTQPAVNPELPSFGSRTMTGLGGPHHRALSVNQPFANLTPAPFPAVEEREEPSAPSLPPLPPGSPLARSSIPPFGDVNLHNEASSEPGGPLPFQHLLPRSKRGGSRTSIEPGNPSWLAREARPSAGGVGGFVARQKLWLGVAVAALVGSGAWIALAKRGGPPVSAVAERPVGSEPPSAPTGEPNAAVVAPKPTNEPAAAPPDAGTARVAEAPSADPPPAAAPTPAPTSAADFATAKLDDSQLVVLFELEERTTLPSCTERLGDKLKKYSGNDVRRSQQQVKAAERKLASGDAMEAHELACSAVAYSPRNAAAQRTLAELALWLGDPAQAKTAVDRALARTPKDKALLALRGDALALMGDIAGSRSLWLRSGPAKGSKAARTKKLVASYEKLGAKALTASKYAEAAVLFRRVVILTHGAFGPSLSLSEALLGLERSRAALVWAERAARAFPKNSRMQVLFGDALFENGQNDKARAAWQVALDVQPSNRVAARRLREGKP